MKLFVWFLFAALPWLPWVGDWALRWTEGNEALQIAFVMFIFPLAMNAIQYWIIDSFIMDKKKGAEQGYERVETSEDAEDGSGGSSFTEVEEESERANAKIIGEANATPVPVGTGAGRSSGRSSPRKDD